MSDFLYLAGQYANAIEQALSVAVSDEDATFVKAYLYDTRPGNRFKFGSNGADATITADMNRVVNGDFETSTLDGWTEVVTGTGATSEEGTLFHGGAKALKCTAGSGTAARYRDFTVRSGQRLYLDAWARADATGTARIRVRNLATGNYLTSAGAWQAASTDAATQTGTTYTQKTLAFTVESLDACQASTVTLRLTLACEGATGIAYFDDVAIYPTVNFCGVFGHNLGPIVSPLLRSSTDNFSSSDVLEDTLTIKRPAFYGHLATPINARYWRLKLSGTNLATPWLGELVIGYAEAIAGKPSYGFVTSTRRPQSRFKTPGGESWIYGVTADALPSLRLSFRDTESEATYLELRDEIITRCGYGEFPVIVVPASDEAPVVHGRVSDTLETARTLLDVWDTDSVMIEGSGLPTVGA